MSTSSSTACSGGDRGRSIRSRRVAACVCGAGFSVEVACISSRAARPIESTSSSGVNDSTRRACPNSASCGLTERDSGGHIPALPGLNVSALLGSCAASMAFSIGTAASFCHARTSSEMSSLSSVQDACPPACGCRFVTSGNLTISTINARDPVPSLLRARTRSSAVVGKALNEALMSSGRTAGTGSILPSRDSFNFSNGNVQLGKRAYASAMSVTRSDGGSSRRRSRWMPVRSVSVRWK